MSRRPDPDLHTITAAAGNRVGHAVVAGEARGCTLREAHFGWAFR